MEKRILFVQHDENTQNAKKVRIHLEADRSAALELLTLGTRCLMETLNISLYEYLEALMEAKELDLSDRVLIDTSMLFTDGEESGDKDP